MDKNKRLASFLTTLLGVCVVTEATLGTYVGLKMFMAKQEQEFQAARYEAYLEEQEQRRENPPKIQYAGPTMRVVDGVLMDWDDHIIPEPVPVESGKTAPAVSMPKSNLEENTTEPEAAPTVQQTSKPVGADGSNDSKADSSGSEKTSGNSQSNGSSTSSSGSSGDNNQSASSDKSNNSGNGSSGSSNKAPSKADTSGNTTVYVSDNASKIHSKSNCSGMKNYREMTKSEADANNYEYCQNCWN